MQIVELYISSTRVDLFKDESVTITDTIINAKDISKVFTAFSQQFSLPASSTNNLIFKHYYNWDIVGGFDARVTVAAILKLNGVDYKIGKVKLNSVSMKDNKAYSYKVVFYGDTITLNGILGEDKLSNLDSLDNLNLNYTANDIKTKLEIDPSTTDIIAPLITHTKRLYYNSVEHSTNGDGNLYYHGGTVDYHGVLWSDLKYAIRVHRIIQAIEVQYPAISFSTEFFNTTNTAYHDLFMWLHRKSGAVFPEEQIPLLPNNVTGWATGTGDWSSITNASTLTVLDEFQNYSNSDTLLRLSVTTTDTENYTLIVYKDGQMIYISSQNGNTILDTTQTGGVPFGLPNQTAGIYTVGISVVTTMDFSISWTVENNSGAGATTDSWAISGLFTASSVFEFIVKLQTPDIKIIDFITGLFKMFNLIAYVQEDGKVYVDTLDNFYATSTVYDISKYIDVDSNSVDVALPYREIKFKYEGLKTFLAAEYEQLQGQEWGTEYYSTNNNLYGGVYELELPFEHMMFERLFDSGDSSGQTLKTIQYGYCVNDNQQPYIGSPILFYPILKSGAGTSSISFLTDVNTRIQLSSYIIPSNSVSLSAATSKANINFSNEFNEYTAPAGGGQNFTETLYENYYSSYIQNLFNENARMVQHTAYLPLSIILNYTLADIFIVNGQQFRINSLNINLTNNKSQLELITI
jgi:hypothetical protein